MLDSIGFTSDICKPAGNTYSVFSPLHWAAAMGDASIVRVLLLELDDPHEAWTSLRLGGCTPCELAANSCAEIDISMILGDPSQIMSAGGLQECQSSATSPVVRSGEQDPHSEQCGGANGEYTAVCHGQSPSSINWSFDTTQIFVIFIVTALGCLMAAGSSLLSCMSGFQLAESMS